MKKIGTDIKYIGRIKAFDCKKCGQPLLMMGCGNPECEDYWKKDESVESIYDEALQEIAKDFGLDNDDIIIKALERAKKVEEMLDIYKRNYQVQMCLNDRLRLIEIEKELEEMK